MTDIVLPPIYSRSGGPPPALTAFTWYFSNNPSATPPHTDFTVVVNYSASQHCGVYKQKSATVILYVTSAEHANFWGCPISGGNLHSFVRGAAMPGHDEWYVVNSYCPGDNTKTVVFVGAKAASLETPP